MTWQEQLSPRYGRTARRVADIWEIGRRELRARGWRQVQLETLSGFVWEKDDLVACLDFALEYELEPGRWSRKDRQTQHDSLINRYGPLRPQYLRREGVRHVFT